MSDAIFPTFLGLKWDQEKVPIFETIVQRSVSLKEARVSLAEYPLYEYTLSYEVLRDNVALNELHTLLGFYLSRKGAYEKFKQCWPRHKDGLEKWLSIISNPVKGGKL